MLLLLFIKSIKIFLLLLQKIAAILLTFDVSACGRARMKDSLNIKKHAVWDRVQCAEYCFFSSMV